MIFILYTHARHSHKIGNKWHVGWNHFGIIVGITLSPFWILWKCGSEKSAFQVTYSYNFGFSRPKKMQIMGKININKNDMKVKNKKSRNEQISCFSPLCQLHFSKTNKVKQNKTKNKKQNKTNQKQSKQTNKQTLF